MEGVNALARVEAELGAIRRRRGRQVVAEWAQVCSLFGRAEAVVVPADVPAWVWTLRPHEADAVLRQLVSLAQAGDQTAAPSRASSPPTCAVTAT